LDTKLKKWTAINAVKIACFVLIIALSFVTLNRFFAVLIKSEETRVNLDIVITDLSTEQYFYRQHMGTAYHYVYQLMRLQSEESIAAGDHLVWIDYLQDNWYGHRYDNNYWQDNWYGHRYDINYWHNDGHGHELVLVYELMDSNGYTSFGSVYAEDLESRWELRLSMEQRAIRQQLDSFKAAEEYVNKADGLLFYVSSNYGAPSDDRLYPAVSRTNVAVSSENWNEEYFREYFRSQPVFYIEEAGLRPEHSHNDNFGYTLYPYQISQGRVFTDSAYLDAAIYIAFTEEAVYAQNSIYFQVRSEIIQDISIIAIALLLALVLFVILMLGAGRKRAVGAEKEVFFTPIDKPYLDLSLAFLIGWTVLVLYLSVQMFETFWQFRSQTAINMLFAGMSVLLVGPILLWFLSLAKRLKAGRFWKYSLIYALPSRVFRLGTHIIRSLWAGLRLTVKVGIISGASFFIMLFIGLVGIGTARGGGFVIFPIALLLTAVIAFLLLRYAHRIHALAKGASDASCGIYDVPISVGGGELGSIASSINNISAGINIAVEQRLKSERLKTELITNVSHDIRTPLTSIITYTDLLKHEGLDNEKAPEYLEVLIQKSQRLKTLTEELFEAAKAASGNIDVNITELDIVSLIDQVLGELDGAIRSSGLDLRLHLPERLIVRADGKLMWRVLENLMSNVFKYALPGSRVYLEAGLADNALVRIDIKNISAAELNVDPSELTERFKRGDGSRTEGSSGLGLSIVQSFMLAQGGRFTISIDGDLFKATVYLPR